MSKWEEAYKSSPPWDIGAPQPEIVKLVKNGEVQKGTILDIGCGLGYNAIFLAKNGFTVTCIDISRSAIEKGRIKAKEQNVQVDFIVGDVFRLEEYFNKKCFHTIIDSGLFHTIGDNERPLLIEKTARVLISGGNYFLLCFSEKEPGNWGPRRISKKEIKETFSICYTINYIRDTFFADHRGLKVTRAYIASMNLKKDNEYVNT